MEKQTKTTRYTVYVNTGTTNYDVKMSAIGDGAENHIMKRFILALNELYKDYRNDPLYKIKQHHLMNIIVIDVIRPIAGCHLHGYKGLIQRVGQLLEGLELTITNISVEGIHDDLLRNRLDYVVGSVPMTVDGLYPSIVLQVKGETCPRYRLKGKFADMHRYIRDELKTRGMETFYTKQAMMMLGDDYYPEFEGYIVTLTEEQHESLKATTWLTRYFEDVMDLDIE